MARSDAMRWTYEDYLAFRRNVERDIAFSHDYILAPGSDVVEIVSTVGNNGSTFVGPVATVMDSGGAEEVFLTNYQGFGALGFSALLQVQPPVRYTAFVGSAATWGFVAEAEPNAAINLFGITAVVPGFDSPLAVLTSNPDNGPGPGLLEFKKGKRTSWRRGIVVTDGAGGTEPVDPAVEEGRRPEAEAIAQCQQATGTDREAEPAMQIVADIAIDAVERGHEGGAGE